MTIPTPQEVHNLIARLRRNPEFIGNIEEAAAALSAYQQEVATLRERVRWFESSGGVAVHTRVFQEMARAEQAEARVRELEQERDKLRQMLDESLDAVVAEARQSAFAEAAQYVRDLSAAAGRDTSDMRALAGLVERLAAQAVPPGATEE
jgi:hypothetical protein